LAVLTLAIDVEAHSLSNGCDSGYSCAYTNTVSWSRVYRPQRVEPGILEAVHFSEQK
jgi:hypothetical protein